MDPDRSCRSKRVYWSRRDARHVERMMSWLYRKSFYFYRCQHCGGYYVAHLVPGVAAGAPSPSGNWPGDSAHCVSATHPWTCVQPATVLR